MAQFPAMPLWTDAYLADTTHLTTLEHGAYLLLLISLWRSGGYLPNDDRRLARCARLTLGQWRRMRPTLMEFLDVTDDGQIMQGRVLDELKAVRQKSKSQSNKAKARWLKNKETGDAAASPGHSRTDASLIHIPKPSLRSGLEKVGSSEKSTSPPAAPDGASRATPCLIPDDWQPNETNRDWLEKSGMPKAQQADVIDEFKRWAKNSKRLLANWDLAFSRNPAVKNAVGRVKTHGPNGANGHGPRRLGVAKPAPRGSFIPTAEEIEKQDRIMRSWGNE